MMLRIPLVLVFACLAFVCWGAYGPVLHAGQEAMHHSRWRPFVCVGWAYFLVAVLIPSLLTRAQAEPGRWTLSGTLWSLLAGSLGCLGSLGVIVAFNYGGNPFYVMPLIFGGAPVVNTLVTLLTSRAARPGVLFYLGIAMVALGAAGVLVYKPVLAAPVVPPAAPVASAGQDSSPPPEAGDSSQAERVPNPAASDKSAYFLQTILAVIATILCWGCYGPTLHQGQIKMEGSRLRPFVCVGIAYFFLAIIIPLFILYTSGEAGAWTLQGCMWSTLAGVLGALGALGVILAFNSGGSPVLVMPLVFGGAPVVNTLITSYWDYQQTGRIGDIRSPFVFSLGLVIAGAVTVLVFGPRGVRKPAKVE